MKGMTGKRKLSSGIFSSFRIFSFPLSLKDLSLSLSIEEVSAREKELEGLLFGKDIVTTKSQWEDIEEAVQVS